MVQQMRLFRIAAILLCTCGNIVGESELRKGESEAGVGRRAEALWTANAHTGTWTFLVFLVKFVMLSFLTNTGKRKFGTGKYVTEVLTPKPL